jgi:MBG domain (YGX type)
MTYQLGGTLVAGDALVGALTRVAGENVGPYQIQQGTLTAGGNYAITFVPAILTISSWNVTGFYNPVTMSPTATPVYNTIKGGSTVPLKFNIYAGSVERTSVADVLGFGLQPIVCGTVEDPVEEFTTTGGTTLRYDTTGHQFIQNWQSPKGANACYKVTMTAQDGSKISAYFKTK